MSFASPLFIWFFLPAVVLAYWLLPLRLRNSLLVAASVLFYVWGGGGFIALLFADIAVNYVIALAIGRAVAADKARRADALLTVAVVFDLALLIVWKYATFATTQANVVLDGLGVRELAVPELVLPIGISFFTFHCISYVVDVRRETKEPLRHPRDFILYITLFPQLIAGPIVRYHEIADQLRPSRRDRWADLTTGASRFGLGLCKKVLVADSVAPIADAVFAQSSHDLTTASAWLGALAYTVQIYFDFSGYSDMAIGLARIFGFQFPENFARPYTASSMTDFWRRWHMSLSRWVRDYVYVPLGGNRRGARSTYRNLLVVFLLTGLWHGANWTFVLWGLYHGSILMIERRIRTDAAGGPWRRALTFVLVIFGWVLFRAVDLGHAVDVAHHMAVPSGFALADAVRVSLTGQRVLALVFGLTAPFLSARRVAGIELAQPGQRPALLRAAVALGVPYAAVLVAAGTFSPFLYFQF